MKVSKCRLLSTRFYNKCKNEVDCEVSKKLNLIEKTKYRNEDVLHILRSNVNEAMESARIRLEVLDDFVRWMFLTLILCKNMISNEMGIFEPWLIYLLTLPNKFYQNSLL